MIKPGCDIKGLKPEILLAIQEVREIFSAFGALMVLTSLMRTEGSRSLHRFGYAADFRIKTIHADRWVSLTEEIKRALGPQYDVILEDQAVGGPHIHVEFDPKGV